MKRQEQYHRNRHAERAMGKHVLHAGDPGGGVIQALKKNL